MASAIVAKGCRSAERDDKERDKKMIAVPKSFMSARHAQITAE